MIISQQPAVARVLRNIARVVGTDFRGQFTRGYRELDDVYRLYVQNSRKRHKYVCRQLWILIEQNIQRHEELVQDGWSSSAIEFFGL